MNNGKRSSILPWVLALVVIQGLAIAVFIRIEARREAVRSRSAFESEHIVDRDPVELVLEQPPGRTVSLADLRGTPVLLHFWATWCPPCREELPALLTVAGDMTREGRLTFVLVALEEDWDAVQQFFDGEIPPWVYLDPSGQARTLFELSTLPDTYLLDAGGSPRLRVHGARNWTTDGARQFLRTFTATPRPQPSPPAP